MSYTDLCTDVGGVGSISWADYVHLVYMLCCDSRPGKVPLIYPEWRAFCSVSFEYREASQIKLLFRKHVVVN